MCKICIFAGTTEGRTLVERLTARGMHMTVCVATEYGETLMGGHPDVTIRSGRMTAEEMAVMIENERPDAVVDATHPYAKVVTENIVAACEQTHTRYLRLLRTSGASESDGIFVPDARACAEYLENTQGNILLTTGSKELPEFCSHAALKDRLYVRMLPMMSSIQVCADCGVAPDHIIAMQGPFTEEMNIALMNMTRAKYLVTKDTGSAGGYMEKIRAAQAVNARTVIIGRPGQMEGYDLDGMTALLEQSFHLTPQRKKVVLAGIGMGSVETRTLGLERAIREADCLIGARRMLESTDCAGKRVFIAIAPEDIGAIIRRESGKRFAVLLSGDTGFYSGAKALVSELGDMDVEILPGIGSLQYFCAKLQRSWDDVCPISLHGRECDLVGRVIKNSAVFALVGGEGGVESALRRLEGAGLGELNVHVGEKLGYPDERISHGTARELLKHTFDTLSVLLVENPGYQAHVVTHGLPDEAFDRDETPMTKMEVRAISISKLQLTKRAVVYDIGSGSGSVSVEMAMQASLGKVYAVEMKEKAIALTRRNGEKFHLSNLAVVEGTAPGALEALPAPTHAFIGGSSGNMRDIIDCLLKKNPRVRIVINTVTLESLTEATEIAGTFDFCDIAEVNVSKPRRLGRYNLMTAQNPVFVFTMQNA